MDRSDQRQLAQWACECAEHVLLYFERERLGDDRPRRAVQAGRAWARGELSMTQARAAAFAAHVAARDAQSAQARAAARAAGHAAATAYVAAHARHAASYAVRAAGKEGDSEREWQLQRLPDQVRAFVFPPD